MLRVVIVVLLLATLSALLGASTLVLGIAGLVS
jgi:hypothetical protein